MPTAFLRHVVLLAALTALMLAAQTQVPRADLLGMFTTFVLMVVATIALTTYRKLRYFFVIFNYGSAVGTLTMICIELGEDGENVVERLLYPPFAAGFLAGLVATALIFAVFEVPLASWLQRYVIPDRPES